MRRWLLLVAVLGLVAAQKASAVYVLLPGCDKPWWWLDPNCWW